MSECGGKRDVSLASTLWYMYKLEATREEIESTHEKFFQRGGLYEGTPKYYNRTAEPEEIANLASFLVSDLAAAINGQIILADSGKLAAATGEGFTGPVKAPPPLSLS